MAPYMTPRARVVDPQYGGDRRGSRWRQALRVCLHSTPMAFVPPIVRWGWVAIERYTLADSALYPSSGVKARGCGIRAGPAITSDLFSTARQMLSKLAVSSASVVRRELGGRGGRPSLSRPARSHLILWVGAPSPTASEAARP
jgi:hypothetical protein